MQEYRIRAYKAIYLISVSSNGDGKKREQLPFIDFCHYFNSNIVQLILKRISIWLLC